RRAAAERPQEAAQEIAVRATVRLRATTVRREVARVGELLADVVEGEHERAGPGAPEGGELAQDHPDLRGAREADVAAPRAAAGAGDQRQAGAQVGHPLDPVRAGVADLAVVRPLQPAGVGLAPAGALPGVVLRRVDVGI